MIEQEIDQMLEEQVMRFLGIRSHRISMPLDLISITCLFLMVDRERAMQKTPEKPKDRFNGETFFSELTQSGITVNGLSIKKFNALIQNGYFSVDAHECYTAEPAAFILTGFLDRMFPRMQGLVFVSYFMQTIEEVISGRKNREQALEQAAQMIASQGKERTPDSFSPEEKKYLKKLITESSQGGVSSKSNGQPGQVSKRDKLFNVLAIRMKKMGGIPSFPYHAAKLKKVIELEDRSIIKISEVLMTDFPLVMRILYYANTQIEQKEKTGIASVSQALMALGGADKAKRVAAEILSTSETNESLLKNERETLCHFILLKSITAKRIATFLNAEGVEEICVNVMFFHFGQILIMHYLPEAYQSVKHLAISKKIDCDTAAREILGATCEAIGVKIATDWGLPFNTIESMKISQQKRVGFSKSTLLRCMPYYINDICLAYTQMDSDEENSIKTLTLLAESLCIPRNTLLDMLNTAWVEFDTHFSGLQPKMERESFFSGIASIVI